MMDKEFKEIFDKLREKAEKAEKIRDIMNGYQTHLDKMVEAGAMTEHEARMDFFCKTHEVIDSFKNNEEDEDDSIDETGREEEAEEEDDDGGCSPDITVRVDLHHHCGDAGRSND